MDDKELNKNIQIGKVKLVYQKNVEVLNTIWYFISIIGGKIRSIHTPYFMVKSDEGDRGAFLLKM